MTIETESSEPIVSGLLSCQSCLYSLCDLLLDGTEGSESRITGFSQPSSSYRRSTQYPHQSWQIPILEDLKEDSSILCPFLKYILVLFYFILKFFLISLLAVI
jgi:hypothetical protein